MDLFRKKSVDQLVSESTPLKRTLKTFDLTMLGIGAIIGTGIFVLTGKGALTAGPALCVSFLLAAICCGFAGLCYAEFAAMAPVSGSAYSYAYLAFGELIAFVIGWDLILEYALQAATVSAGWSGYFNKLLEGFGLHLPVELTAAYGTTPGVTTYFNLPGFVIVLIITWVLSIGINQTKKTNDIMVMIKLAIIVLFLFLRNFGSTIVIGISIPMSIIATFALIYFCGYNLNIMTLGGLALGVGMLVDNSIVVLENITRLRDNGMPPDEAAIKGTSEVAIAITASTLTTLAVFLPLLFMEGMAGVMFKQFSSVVTFSLTCSLFTAITLVPMMAAKCLSSSFSVDDPNLSPLKRVLASTEYFQRWLERLYGGALDVVLRRRWLFIAALVLLVASVVPLVWSIGTELMPKADEGEVRVFLEMEVGTSPEVVNEMVKSTEDVIREVCGDDMNGWVTFAGASSWRASGGHKANYNIRLKPRTRRERSDQQIAEELDKRFKGWPGTVFRVRAGQGLFSRMMGAGSGEGVAVEIRGYDFDVAAALAAQVSRAMESVKGITDVKLSRDLGVPEDRLYIDRDKANDLGVPVRQVAEALRTILAGSEAGEFREDGDEYTILVKVKDADLLTLDQILDLSMRNDKGELIVLRNLIDYDRVMGPVNIERKNQERVLTVGGNILNRDLGSVVADIQEKLTEIPMPPSFSLLFSGDYEDQQESFRELMFAFVLALVLVYMVMACQFESLRDPLVVMFSVPLAGFGVILALYLTKTTFNMQSFIGCIMLAGIVVNNAILLVDTANLLRREGLPLDRAIREAGTRRLRPILMTTLTTVLGLLPLALGFGDGGETQAPMARAVIGGLSSSTFITLFFIPAVYSVAESLFRRKKKEEIAG